MVHNMHHHELYGFCSQNACYAKPFCKDLLPKAQVMQSSAGWRVCKAIDNFIVPPWLLAKKTRKIDQVVGAGVLWIPKKVPQFLSMNQTLECFVIEDAGSSPWASDIVKDSGIPRTKTWHPGCSFFCTPNHTKGFSHFYNAHFMHPSG